MSGPPVSVIIPTYNRRASLLRTLASLGRQTYPADRFEVILVDDGSTDGTSEVARLSHPFACRYVYQQNQGDALARNRGAREARGEILQFLDDDIVLAPGFLAAVVHEHLGNDKLILVGHLLVMPSSIPTVFEQVAMAAQRERNPLAGEIHFTEMLSGVLSLRRQHFFALGTMQPVAQTGSSVWCDVEFAYRAHIQGFSFRRCADAVGYHDDYALRDLRASCQRVRRAGAAGADLLRRHPTLQGHLPMFRDKSPIQWHHDPPALIGHKIARQAVSSAPAMSLMERFVPVLERRAPASRLLPLLYRWINSGYIYRGYREGLRELEA